MRKLLFITATLICCILTSPAQNLQDGIRIYKDKKVALVIGNAAYPFAPLRNPENDAEDISAALAGQGFDVLHYENLGGIDDMKRAVRLFGQRLQDGEVGLFYFAGHGIQINGINYLIPVDAEINFEEEVEYEALDVGFVMAQMEAARNQMNIVILDACRNNPFARSFRSAGRGLAGMIAPTGTLIAYATAPGSVASDGYGRNGLYTEELLAQIREPGLKIEEVFKNVRTRVLEKSNGLQVPWESSSLIGDFYFTVPGDLAAGPQPQEYTPLATVRQEPPATELTAMWKAFGDNFWLEVNGRSIEKETNHQWSANRRDLLVTQNITGERYLLQDFTTSQDNRWRPALIITPRSPDDMQSAEETGSPYPMAIWRANRNGYWLYLDGMEVSEETRNEWRMEHLLVEHPRSGLSFMLRDYSKKTDNELRPAEIVLPRSERNALVNVLWKANDKGYTFFVNGNNVTSGTMSSREGNDLRVNYRARNASFIMKDYWQSLDNVWREALPAD